MQVLAGGHPFLKSPARHQASMLSSSPPACCCRAKEPWEASDGAVYMLRELSGEPVLSSITGWPPLRFLLLRASQAPCHGDGPGACLPSASAGFLRLLVDASTQPLPQPMAFACVRVPAQLT